MIRIFTAILSILISINFSFPQAKDFSPLQGKLLLSVNGGITIPQTDFKEVKPGPLGTGSLEYYFRLRSMHALGVRIFGGAGTLKRFR